MATVKAGYSVQNNQLVVTILEASGVTRKLFVTRYVPTSPLFADFRYRFCHLAYPDDLTDIGEAPPATTGYFRSEIARIPLGNETAATLENMMEGELARFVLEYAGEDSPSGSPSISYGPSPSGSGSPDYVIITYNSTALSHDGEAVTYQE